MGVAKPASFDTPEEISAAIVTLRFGTPELELTGKAICRQESDREQGRAIPVTPTIATSQPQALRQESESVR